MKGKREVKTVRWTGRFGQPENDNLDDLEIPVAKVRISSSVIQLVAPSICVMFPLGSDVACHTGNTKDARIGLKPNDTMSRRTNDRSNVFLTNRVVLASAATNRRQLVSATAPTPIPTCTDTTIYMSSVVCCMRYSNTSATLLLPNANSHFDYQLKFTEMGHPMQHSH